MKNESAILEGQMVEKAQSPRPLGIAFSHANMVKGLPAKVGSGVFEPAETGDARNWQGGIGAALADFLKPTFSNLFLLGCLMGLFVLYCCSCVIHALTFPARRKSS